jgi:hypothetical protein
MCLLLFGVTSKLNLSSAFFLQNFQGSNIKKVVSSNPLFPELEDLIFKAKNGIETANGEQVKELMVRISDESREGDQRKALPGSWELIYTTEKEINFFKTSWPFAKVSSITQDLDLYGKATVENFINFEGGGQFAVTGAVQPVEGDDVYDRVAFHFTSAKARVWGRSISLPPTGAGWFDTMFCNEEYRLSRDSRGDWSVFRRVS